MAKESGAPRGASGARRITPRAGLRVSWAPPNNGMHPTRDTEAVMESNLAGGRVMPGVRCFANLGRV
jgi:hypothetical protein